MKKILTLKDENGFTLIEMILVITILTIVMAIAASILIQIFNIVPSSNQRMSTRQLAEINLSTIASLMKNAESIDDDNDTITINENGSSKIIKLENKTIKKGNEVIINDIQIFNIKKDEDTGQDNLYTITIEKCSQKECEENAKLSEQVLIRN